VEANSLGRRELELDVLPRELASGPKVPQGTWIALGTEGTSGNHVCLGEFGPICPKQHISFVNLGPFCELVQHLPGLGPFLL
jgi:hypothetical protein